MYKDDSIKSMERRRRGSGEKRIIQGENTRRPENWKEFLGNDDNKQQLIALLLKIWSTPECSRKLQKKEVIAICEEKAYILTSDGKTVEKSEILSLESDQVETDTRVVLYYSFTEQEKKPVRTSQESRQRHIFHLALLRTQLQHPYSV
ncbi:hypothetical protein SNE40_002706 [Patella caerulea]|uniref:Uncharacterized protein n=1 Tax=Patella caerulea TaxID=87958 RepID=A0AAN8K979_PATCE